MNKKCWLFIILAEICLVVLAYNIFVFPTLMLEVGKEFAQPKALNSLLAVGFFGFMMFFALERQGLKDKEEVE